MKKRIIFVCLSFLLAASAFCSDFGISFDFGIETGIPFYGDVALRKANDTISYDSGKRIVIGAITDINFNIVKYLTCFVGSDLLCDFNWNDSDYFNHLDLAIFPGVKVYPGMGGFNVSFAYVIGIRFDFCQSVSYLPESSGDENLDDAVPDSIPETKPAYSFDPAFWGNGIRIGMEYNFAHSGKSRFRPSVGAYWRWVPRGNYHKDNVIGVYGTMNF